MPPRGTPYKCDASSWYSLQRVEWNSVNYCWLNFWIKYIYNKIQIKVFSDKIEPKENIKYPLRKSYHFVKRMQDAGSVRSLQFSDSVVYERLWTILYERLWTVLYEQLRMVLYERLWTVLVERLWTVLYEQLWTVIYERLRTDSHIRQTNIVKQMMVKQNSCS